MKVQSRKGVVVVAYHNASAKPDVVRQSQMTDDLFNTDGRPSDSGTTVTDVIDWSEIAVFMSVNGGVKGLKLFLYNHNRLRVSYKFQILIFQEMDPYNHHHHHHHHHNEPPPPPPPHTTYPPPPHIAGGHYPPPPPHHHQPPYPPPPHVELYPPPPPPHTPAPASYHHQPPPPTPPQHIPHISPIINHHNKQPPKYTDNKPTVRVYCKAKTDYALTIRDGKVILAPSNSSDLHQHWIKDEKFSTRVKDEQGYPSFALVNKATGQAIKHSIGATYPVQLTEYNPDKLDESVLWTESKDLGDGYRAVRMVNNIRLNVDAFNGDKNHGGVHDGTKIVLWEWKKDSNQRWNMAPYSLNGSDLLLDMMSCGICVSSKLYTALLPHLVVVMCIYEQLIICLNKLTVNKTMG
ncbi:hypothetical protein QVD17_37494 [Tagetes erecta]|uniref:Hydroxyproline-rich glycoprotein family protein n=1 Tax=Tagetes erecta TaxID=13708 RepID=A0AAD8JYD2_TARER|nr:hypothetical protein QVD17_37494 [Tagetes erecta]